MRSWDAVGNGQTCAGISGQTLTYDAGANDYSYTGGDGTVASRRVSSMPSVWWASRPSNG